MASKTRFPLSLYTTMFPTFTRNGDMTPEVQALLTSFPRGLYTPSLCHSIGNLTLQSDRLTVCFTWTQILGTYFDFAPPTVEVCALQRYFLQLDVRSPLPWIPGYLGLMPRRGIRLTSVHFLQMRCCAPPGVGQGPDWLDVEEMMAEELAGEYGEEVARERRVAHGMLTIGCYVRFYRFGSSGFLNALVEGRETLHVVEDHGLIVRCLEEIRDEW